MNSRARLRRAAGCLFLGLAAACQADRRPPAAAIPVTVAKAERRTVPFEITAPGAVEPIQAVAVMAQVSGVVLSVPFREGDLVEAGQILAQIDPRPYRNALHQAEATLARDLVQLDNAKRQVDRYRQLATNEYVTSEQFEGFRTVAEALAATVQSDSANVDNARLNLEYTTIRSPIAGRTGSLLIKEGNVVRGQGTAPLVLVNQTKPILVRFAVPASFLPVIRAHRDQGLVVKAKSNEDSTALTGKLQFLDNAVDTTTGTILLKAQFDNAAGTLWPGQFVTATLALFEEKDVVVVPVPAVIDAEAGRYVFVVDKDGGAVTRPIKAGRTVGDLVIVTQGLDPGEVVVTDGQLRLTPGAKVEIKTLDGDTKAPADAKAPREKRKTS